MSATGCSMKSKRSSCCPSDPAGQSATSDWRTPNTGSDARFGSPRRKTCVIRVSWPGAWMRPCRCAGREGERRVACSSAPTGPSVGIGQGTGTAERNQKPPPASVVSTPRPCAAARPGRCTSYRPSSSDCQTSTVAPAMAAPSVLCTVPCTTQGAPLAPWATSPPLATGGAPSTWKGPNTVDSVQPGARSPCNATTCIDAPSTSLSRMNSCRCASHARPTAVRKSMPCFHSGAVSRVSRMKSCRCPASEPRIERRRGSGVSPNRSTSCCTRSSEASAVIVHLAAPGGRWTASDAESDESGNPPPRGLGRSDEGIDRAPAPLRRGAVHPPAEPRHPQALDRLAIAGRIGAKGPCPPHHPRCGARVAGGLGERFNPAVLKTAGPKGPVSSNLTASAMASITDAASAGAAGRWASQPTGTGRSFTRHGTDRRQQRPWLLGNVRQRSPAFASARTGRGCPDHPDDGPAPPVQHPAGRRVAGTGPPAPA